MVERRRVLGGAAQPVALFGADGEPLVAADFAGGGGGGGGSVTQGTSPWVISGAVTQGTSPWVISGALTEAEFEAIVGEVDDDPTANTLLERLKQIQAELSGLLSTVPRNSSGTEIGTSANPIEVTQAALAVGVDQVAGVQVDDWVLAATASGESTVKTPASGNFLRIWKVAFALTGDTAVSASLRYGASNTDHYTTYLHQVGVHIAHGLTPNYKDLAVDEALIINLSGDPSTGSGGVLCVVQGQEITP